MREFKWAASCAVIAVACLTAPAYAQDAGSATVEEIIVTAQKREQNLQDVPIVVAVVSGQQLQDAGVRDVKDLQTVTPGLSVTSSTSEAQTSIRIRGVGTIGDNPGLESSVGTVVDGVYRARSGVAFGDLGELERIEILKGPQGTLFGKNTSAGVINVITKEPSFEFGAQGELTLGNYDARGVSATVTGPVAGDKLAGRLYVAKRERDGFYTVNPGKGPRTTRDDQDQNFYTIRGQLLWLPTDTLKVRLLADLTDRDEHCCVNVPTFRTATGVAGAGIVNALAGGTGTVNPTDPWTRSTYANREMVQDITDKGFSGEVTWDINDDVTLTSISAYRVWQLTQGSDIDYSGADIWYRDADKDTSQEFKVFSQEVRLAGSTDKLDWLVGAFYADEKLEARTFTKFGSDYERYFSLLFSSGASPTFVSAITGLPAGANFPAGQGPKDIHEHKSAGWALFTNNTWHVTDAFEITLGLRYTDEEKKVSSLYTNSAPANACASLLGQVTAGTGPFITLVPAASRPTVLGALCAPHSDPAFNNTANRQSRTENRWSGTLKASYRVNDALMAYASYASGFKSGGFNLDRARLGFGVINRDTSFPAETVVSYELGVKSNLFGNRVILNAAWFDQKYEGFQLNTFTGVSWIVESIPEVTSRGVDLDAMWRTPIEGLRFNAGVTYAETQFGKQIPATLSQRLVDSRLSYAPLWSASWGGSYEGSIGMGLIIRASLSGKFTSEYNTGSNLDPNKSQQSMTIWNGRIGVGSEDERWMIEAWAQNLTNVDYYQVVVDQPLQSGTFAAFLGAPRTAGVTLRAKF
ncbi:TonB-dependent receptor [Caulobacter mirabilis]|uniref:TonB-dependent receptor n=1 Tax=Caulobacter mirabilis TaxID=69666 RepID=A0A2D2B4E2_9CAUL|nr:TonB-dependent receptor [Caulobacter mirabilis]ATQ45096.1 TonB-dependent receptor [Caulobacter mirabilis]